MKDLLAELESVAELARKEEVPEGDVRADVILRIREGGGRLPMKKPLLIFAAGYAAATLCVALVFGGSLTESESDPLSSVFEEASGLITVEDE